MVPRAKAFYYIGIYIWYIQLISELTIRFLRHMQLTVYLLCYRT